VLSRGSSRAPIRIAACIALVALAAMVLAACGSGGDSTQKLTFKLEGNGKESSFRLPRYAKSGLVEITLVNESDKRGDLQLLRVEGSHTGKEVVAGLEKALKGKPIPDWFFAAGGTRPAEPGQSSTVTQDLKPGFYYAYDGQAGKLNSSSALTVKGDEPDAGLPEADATVTAVDYGFETDGIPAGPTEIAFENSGAQPHQMAIAPLVGDSTAEDVERFFKTEKGTPPLREADVKSTTVLEGDEGQLVSFDLKPGRYVLYCFISDRQGGLPHALKGMVDEVEVE
jgi:hypothetical protein